MNPVEYIVGWFKYAIYRLNNSLFFAGVVMIMLNIGSRYIELKLDPSTENFLKTALSKELLVFSVCWMGTRDLIIALVLTAVFVVLADYGLNANSKCCIMPEKYRVMAQSATMGWGISGNSGNSSGGNSSGSGGAAIGGLSKAGHGPANIVTDKEISDAMDVLERAKKQRENMKHNDYLTAFRSAKF
uniref:Uncharacterized protein n=1 Tax=viral metagenome TaxID=1070528 RepID=A0A6C0M3I5_9ZZZZ